MKKLILALVLSAGIANAGSVWLAWDDDLNPTNTTYMLYASQSILTQTNRVGALITDVGTNKLTLAECVGGNWSFAVAAKNATGGESDISNVLAIHIPFPPNLNVTVQHTSNLTNAWQDVGFFRVKIDCETE